LNIPISPLSKGIGVPAAGLARRIRGAGHHPRTLKIISNHMGVTSRAPRTKRVLTPPIIRQSAAVCWLLSRPIRMVAGEGRTGQARPWLCFGTHIRSASIHDAFACVFRRHSAPPPNACFWGHRQSRISIWYLGSPCNDKKLVQPRNCPGCMGRPVAWWMGQGFLRLEGWPLLACNVPRPGAAAPFTGNASDRMVRPSTAHPYALRLAGRIKRIGLCRPRSGPGEMKTDRFFFRRLRRRGGLRW